MIHAGILLAAVGIAGCGQVNAGPAPTSRPAAQPHQASAPATSSAIWQLSAFALLVRGEYDGLLPVSEVKRHGNLGLGAADQLNGEMALVDGRFYQFLQNGRAVEAPEGMRMPFAAVTTWQGGRDVPVQPGSQYPAVRAALDAVLPTTNAFYALRMEGTWDVVVARTYHRQTRPYPPLGRASADTFTMAAVRGTMVGFREPSYADSLSVPNFHLHFVNAERTQGGHVLSFTARDVRLQYSERPEFILRMPPAVPASP
jgi:acetolactate decarboxylase